MQFYLGTDMPGWLRTVDVPLFISHRRLARYKTLPQAAAPWALDSGGFTELSIHGEWQTPPHLYAAAVRRYHDQIGQLQFAAPQDWMCEPHMLTKTRRTVTDHQRLTVDNFLDLKTLAPDLPIIPTLQGWHPDDYLRHVDQYTAAGINLENEPTVGLGSVCRRQATAEAEYIVQRLQPLRLHGFGMKATAVQRFGSLLASSDSMAWSFGGRMKPDPNCPKKSCAHCLHHAISWRNKLTQQHTPTLFGATTIT